MFSLRLYSHSPLFLFFFCLNVNSYCSFRQEMPNGFPKTYSWHGNEIQICKTFLTWKKETACGNGFVLFSTTQECCFSVTLTIPNVISKIYGMETQSQNKKRVEMCKQLRNLLICHLPPKQGFLGLMESIGQWQVALYYNVALYYPTVNVLFLRCKMSSHFSKSKNETLHK